MRPKALVTSIALLFSAFALSARLTFYPVDKDTSLPADFVPPNLVQIPSQWWTPGFGSETLRADASQALDEMLTDARAQGFTITVRSSYRSYELQQVAFDACVEEEGLRRARLLCARPGHSEHQLGTTVDVTSPVVNNALVQSFGDTAAGRWLADNAYLYGFALSYPPGKSAITGFLYEPWHFRFIGREAAAEWKTSGLTLIEYLEQRQ